MQRGGLLAQLGRFRGLPTISQILRRPCGRARPVPCFDYMTDEPIAFLRADRPQPARNGSGPNSWMASAKVAFDRRELKQILNIYGRMVIAGEWRDYAIDFLEEVAAFSIFRRTSEIPLYRIEKRPKLRNRQGQYAVIAASGHV